MKLWSFSHPHEYDYARAVRVGGTWQAGEYKERRQCLVIEWLPGSDALGDFIWPGFHSDIVITDRVGAALRAAGIPGFELRPVTIRRNRWSDRVDEALGAKSGSGVPALWDFWITQWVHLDTSLSTISRCEMDGTSIVEILGAEDWEAGSGIAATSAKIAKRPRVEGCGAFVRNVQGVFRIEELPALIFCADDVKCFLESHGFTNVDFLEVGDIIA
jgi:hypothetical protein